MIVSYEKHVRICEACADDFCRLGIAFFICQGKYLGKTEVWEALASRSWSVGLGGS